MYSRISSRRVTKAPTAMVLTLAPMCKPMMGHQLPATLPPPIQPKLSMAHSMLSQAAIPSKQGLILPYHATARPANPSATAPRPPHHPHLPAPLEVPALVLQRALQLQLLPLPVLLSPYPHPAPLHQPIAEAVAVALNPLPHLAQQPLHLPQPSLHQTRLHPPSPASREAATGQTTKPVRATIMKTMKKSLKRRLRQSQWFDAMQGTSISTRGG